MDYLMIVAFGAFAIIAGLMTHHSKKSLMLAREQMGDLHLLVEQSERARRIAADNLREALETVSILQMAAQMRNRAHSAAEQTYVEEIAMLRAELAAANNRAQVVEGHLSAVSLDLAGIVGLTVSALKDVPSDAGAIR